MCATKRRNPTKEFKRWPTAKMIGEDNKFIIRRTTYTIVPKNKADVSLVSPQVVLIKDKLYQVYSRSWAESAVWSEREDGRYGYAVFEVGSGYIVAKRRDMKGYPIEEYPLG